MSFPMLTFMPSEDEAVFSATHVDSSSTTTGSSAFTFSSQSIGAAPGGGETRLVVVAIGVVDNSKSMAISSVTIGGVTATIHANGTDTVSGSRSRAAIASAVVPSGTTADVVVNMTTNCTGMAIDVYRIMNPTSTTPADTLATGGNSPSGTIDVPAGGILIAAAQAINAGTGTWNSGNPGTATSEVDIATADYYEGGYEVYASAQTGITVSRDQGNTSLAAASWR